jgi:murein DD-endopeptidase MepM/ murein hydrolase activator NlpD
MTGDKWTFLVVRGEDRPVEQYSVSTRTLRLSAVAGSLLVVAVLGFGLSSGFEGVARVRADRLQVRNQELEQQLTQFDGRIKSLESVLNRLAANDANFRSVAGLEAIDPDVMQAGVGGPGLGSPQASPLWNVDPKEAQATFATGYQLSALERRARLLSESLTEATDSMLAHRDLLESTPSILPTKGWVSSAFSLSRMHPIHNIPLPHEGIDISAPMNTPIFAAAKGKVVRAGWVQGYGLTVEIDHGYGFHTLYGHASKLIAQVGQEVTRGEMIARVGSTGISTGPHLHYEVRVNGKPEDPSPYILPETIRY